MKYKIDYDERKWSDALATGCYSAGAMFRNSDKAISACLRALAIAYYDEAIDGEELRKRFRALYKRPTYYTICRSAQNMAEQLYFKEEEDG